MNISITENTIRFEDESGSYAWPLYMDAPVDHPIIAALNIQQSPVPVRFDDKTCAITAGNDKITPEINLDDYPEEVRAFAETIYAFNGGYYANEYKLKQAGVEAPAEPTPEQLIQREKDLANLEFTNTVNSILSQYAEGEEGTWDTQYAEAEAWDDDNTAETPFLDASISASGEDKSALVASILAKAKAYKQAVGFAHGTKRKKLSSIDG